MYRVKENNSMYECGWIFITTELSYDDCESFIKSKMNSLGWWMKSYNKEKYSIEKI